MKKRNVAILGLVGCISFIFVGLYVYFFRRAPLQLLILDILFFGTGAVVSIVSLISEREGLAIDIEKLSRLQAILIGICSLIFSIVFIWIALAFNGIHIILKGILFYSSITFGVWGVKLLIKQ